MGYYRGEDCYCTTTAQGVLIQFMAEQLGIQVLMRANTAVCCFPCLLCSQFFFMYMKKKSISGGARQAERSLDSAVSSLLALISREYVQLV